MNVRWLPAVVPGPGIDPVTDVLTDTSRASADWLQAGITVAAGIVLAIVVSRVARRLLGKVFGTGFAATMLARFLAYTIFIFSLIYALNALEVRIAPLLGAIGIGGIALALALQEIVENFIGALFIQARRPFTRGDTIEISGTVGVVLDVDARVTILRGLDGVEHRIPNSDVISEQIHNYTREGVRRTKVSVGVAYSTNLERAHGVIVDAVSRVKRVRRAPAPLVVLEQFGESSIDFGVYVWHTSDVPSELAARHDTILAIHQAFAAHDIVIPFPQRVLWSSPDVDPDGPYDEHAEEVQTDLPGTASHDTAAVRDEKSPAGRRFRLGRPRRTDH